MQKPRVKKNKQAGKTSGLRATKQVSLDSADAFIDGATENPTVANGSASQPSESTGSPAKH
jgi:hypothetical protein